MPKCLKCGNEDAVFLYRRGRALLPLEGGVRFPVCATCAQDLREQTDSHQLVEFLPLTAGVDKSVAAARLDQVEKNFEWLRGQIFNMAVLATAITLVLGTAIWYARTTIDAQAREAVERHVPTIENRHIAMAFDAFFATPSEGSLQRHEAVNLKIAKLAGDEARIGHLDGHIDHEWTSNLIRRMVDCPAGPDRLKKVASFSRRAVSLSGSATTARQAGLLTYWTVQVPITASELELTISLEGSQAPVEGELIFANVPNGKAPPESITYVDHTGSQASGKTGLPQSTLGGLELGIVRMHFTGDKQNPKSVSVRLSRQPTIEVPRSSHGDSVESITVAAWASVFIKLDAVGKAAEWEGESGNKNNLNQGEEVKLLDISTTRWQVQKERLRISFLDAS